MAFFSWRTARRVLNSCKSSQKRTWQYAALGFSSLAVSGCTLQAFADAQESTSQFPINKLACHRDVAAPRTPAVLVSCGSFNPPTVMHLRMFDLAIAALAKRGFDVWGCYMSPVADAYGKQGLAPVADRLVMCQLAAADTAQVMVDDWEARQPGYTRTLQVLQHIQKELTAWLQPHEPLQKHLIQQQMGTQLAAPVSSASAAAAAAPQTHKAASMNSGSELVGADDSCMTWQSSQPSRSFSSRSTNSKNYCKQTSSPATTGPSAAAAAVAATLDARASVAPKVMLLCGADLLATMAQPGVWKDPDTILRDHGVVCVSRAGTDVNTLLNEPGSLLHQYRHNIIVIGEPVSNGVSSTKARQLLASGQPVRYLVPEPVIDYIKVHSLYRGGDAGTATAAAG